MSTVMRTRAKAHPALWKWEINRSDLPPSEHHQALSLAVRFNEKGEVPRRWRTGIRKLAEDRRGKTDTVNRDLNSLRDRGWLFIERGRGSRPSRYVATIPWGYELRSRSQNGYRGQIGRGFVSPHPKVCVPPEWPFVSPRRGTNPHSSPYIPADAKAHLKLNPAECTHGSIDDEGYCTACGTTPEVDK